MSTGDDSGAGTPLAPPSLVANDVDGSIHASGRRVAASTISLVASNAVIALLGAVVLSRLTHVLGASSYGELVTALNFVAISTLFTDLGVNTFSGREIARRPEDASEILGQNLGLRLSLSVVLVPVVIGLGYLIYPHSHARVIEGIVIVALTIPFEATRAVSLSYYVATIQNYKSALVALASQVFYVAGVLVALALGFGLTGCFCAYLAGMFLTGLSAYLAVRRRVRFHPRLSWRRWGAIVRQSMGIGSIQIVNVLYVRTNTQLLSMMTTSKVVGLYGLAAAVVTFLLVVPNSYMTSMLPLLVRADTTRLSELVDRATTYMAMAGATVLAGTFALAGPVVHDLASSKFAASASILSILCFSMAFTCLTSVFAYTSFARNRHHLLLVISIGGLLTNVVLDVVLIPSLGARGAAYATDVVEGLILLGTYSIFRRKVGIGLHDWWRLARIVAVGVVVALVGRLVLGDFFTRGPVELLCGLAGIPLALMVAFVALRCLPPGVRLSLPARLAAPGGRD